MGQSENAYLAPGALFEFLPITLFSTKNGIKRYAVLMAVFVTIIKCIEIIDSKVPEKLIGLSGLFGVLIKYDKLTYIIIALWGVVFLLYICNLGVLKRRDSGKMAPHVVVGTYNSWSSYCCVGVI